ncbi:MAG: hypothetical protein Q8830_03745, partial [Candidatus Phytoplasma australasiaticum]|nr:hypothetical protein [Candidatus Phytoplasma australasiaticum]
MKNIKKYLAENVMVE